MFIWKYIEIPQKDIELIQEEFKKLIPSNDYFFQDVRINLFEFMGMKLLHPVLIQVPPMYGLNDNGIHVDIRHGNENGRLAINIPLENCEGSITKFWKTDKPVVVKRTPNGYPYSHFKPEECEQISEFRLTSPIIFDTDIPHSVTNLQPTWRRAISLRFAEDPWHLIGP